MQPSNFTTSIPSQCFLGEGPYWHARMGSFFWVDIENGDLFWHHLASGKTEKRHFSDRVTVVLEGKNEKLILGIGKKLARYDWATEELEWICEVEENFPLHRFNDGKVDPKGRVWIGTLSTEFTDGAGSLYRIGSDLHPQAQIKDLTISNGMAWAVDAKTFYFIDTPTRQIGEYAYDADSGEVQFRRVAVEVPAELGFPDGMCIDQEGMLWVGHYGGSGVYQWNPKTGALLGKIEVPAPHVTSCCFGGENLDTLLITTAQENLSKDELERFPQSGDVFIVETNSRGFLPTQAGF